MSGGGGMDNPISNAMVMQLLLGGGGDGGKSDSSSCSPAIRSSDDRTSKTKDGHLTMWVEAPNDDPRGASPNSSGKRYWCVLNKTVRESSSPSHILLIYHSSKSTHSTRKIDLSTVSHISRSYNSKTKIFGITLHTPEHNYIVQGKDQRTTEEWQAEFDKVLTDFNKNTTHTTSDDDAECGTYVIKNDVPDCPDFSARSLELWEENLVALDRGEWSAGLEENICAFKRYKKKRLPLPSQATLRRMTKSSREPDSPQTEPAIIPNALLMQSAPVMNSMAFDLSQFSSASQIPDIPIRLDPDLNVDGITLSDFTLQKTTTNSTTTTSTSPTSTPSISSTPPTPLSSPEPPPKNTPKKPSLSPIDTETSQGSNNSNSNSNSSAHSRSSNSPSNSPTRQHSSSATSHRRSSSSRNTTVDTSGAKKPSPSYLSQVFPSGRHHSSHRKHQSVMEAPSNNNS
ncbi:hypothetical protein Pelo_11031 [Pelomyxa schiedti]|nr:hypothetical protein Pelo_11031 [Pelomyxa schiedti]